MPILEIIRLKDEWLGASGGKKTTMNVQMARLKISSNIILLCEMIFLTYALLLSHSSAVMFQNSYMEYSSAGSYKQLASFITKN